MVQWKLDDAIEEVRATPEQKERVQQISDSIITDAHPLMEQGAASKTALLDQLKCMTC